MIDERFNGGGWIADYIVAWLNRPLLMGEAREMLWSETVRP